MSARVFGSAIRRREDPRLLTGTGPSDWVLWQPDQIEGAA